MIDFQPYFIWISKNTPILNVICSLYLSKQGNENLQKASWYLHHIKKHINRVRSKLAGKDSLNCFAIFGSSACQGQHVFSMSFLACTAPFDLLTQMSKN